MEIPPSSAPAGAGGAAAPATPGSSSNPSPPAKRPSITLRLLCPATRAAALCPASDLHVEHPPVGDEAVLVVSGPDAPAAAVRVWERVVGHRVGGDEAGEEGEEKEVAGVVGCRMLAAGGQVGCVLGKGGKTVERMRLESGAQIRVFRSREQVPPCALQGDELIHISGSFSAAKKALLLVSTCLQDNPRPDTSNFPSGRPFGPPGSGVGCPPGVDPHSQRSYLPPPHVPDYHARNFSSNGGSTIRALQSETGASVKVIDPVADSDERIIVISARENSEMMHSPSQDALIRVYSKISEASMDKSSSVPARLLVPAQHIGCLLGKGGSIIAEMRKVTGASIRIFGNEQIPRCAQRNEELVQVTGSFQSIQDALRHIAGRIRDLIIPPKPHPSGDHRPPGPPPSHPMEHMSADRMPYPYGCEQGGPRPFVEQPSPRTWAPEAPATDAPRSMPDIVPAVDFRKGPGASENQVATPATTTTEVVIPCKYIGFVCGANDSDLAEIKKISGAEITVHDPKPGDTNSTVIICGDPEQTKRAQSLIHAFIFCGLYQK
ncbi:hypothetical protein CFC21_066504 [Triticum aestivum]|uniref:K Homology domain-containing protein n=2 Tax=Triticum aestivum TaxID=4565 RepID=A0A9R1H762_WHEAT|nr:hypothetical protein CFC21_066504 [Triticum aestivum]